MGRKAKKRRLEHKKRMKRQQEASREAERKKNGWEGCDWRMEGCPEETRYESVQQAERARARVQRMKPNGPKGKKQTGGRRPNFITAERIHHSRGKKWEEFVAHMGIENLSEYEQRQYFDSFNNGGQELFQKWKQRQYESKVVVDRVVVLDYGDRKMIVVRDPETGELKQVPYVDPEEKAEKTKRAVKRSRNSKPKYCVECGMSIALARSAHSDKCSSCAPMSVALASFKAAVKKTQQGASK